jgi:hypothetical protein
MFGRFVDRCGKIVAIMVFRVADKINNSNEYR